MAEGSGLEFGSLVTKIAVVLSLFSVPALAQQTSEPSSAEALTSALPDAPSVQDAQDASPPGNQLRLPLLGLRLFKARLDRCPHYGAGDR